MGISYQHKLHKAIISTLYAFRKGDERQQFSNGEWN